MPWLGFPNELIDFWRPDDGRNRTRMLLKNIYICKAVGNDPRLGQVDFQQRSVSIFIGEKTRQGQYSTLKNELWVNFQPSAKYFLPPARAGFELATSQMLK
jgi:hypothetical protein